MYIPSFNKFEDAHEIVDFMQRYSFAAIITVKDNVPTATHLPFIIEHRDGQIILKSHFAKINPQANEIGDNRALVIFNEPHAYISPKHYEKELNVPTWNYLAVHAYGSSVLIDDKAELLKQTIETFEADYLKQWDKLPETYKDNMMKGIVAFEVIVDDLQAKKKLSQNKTEKERENIIDDLSNSHNTTETELANYMIALKAKQ